MIDAGGACREPIAARAVAFGFALRREAVRAPVVELALQARTGQALALPSGVVGVLDRQVRQGRLAAFGEGGVERAELAHQHAQGPAVGGDVMQGDEERVIVLRQRD